MNKGKGILNTEEAEVLACLLKESDIKPKSSRSTINPREDATRAPLSFPQQRIWFLEQLQLGTAAYNLPGAWKVEGSLDVETFRLAVAEVFRRHQILRTRFRSCEGQP